MSAVGHGGSGTGGPGTGRAPGTRRAPLAPGDRSAHVLEQLVAPNVEVLPGTGAFVGLDGGPGDAKLVEVVGLQHPPRGSLAEALHHLRLVPRGLPDAPPVHPLRVPTPGVFRGPGPCFPWLVL